MLIKENVILIGKKESMDIEYAAARYLNFEGHR